MMISDDEFRRICSIVRDRFGINLTESKRDLVCARLQNAKVLHGHGSLDSYLSSVEQGGDVAAMSELIDKISTNHTFFFRETAHFDFLSNSVLPELEARGQHRDIRVWCAGCSSGEEAYSIVIRMMEHWGPEYSGLNAGVLATDISEKALKFAARAVYPEDKMGGASRQARLKYFLREKSGEWAVRDNVRSEVTLRRFNLMNEKFPFKKPFHVIFCRNVMIYFDAPTRKALVERFSDVLAEGGYLFVGHSETLGRDEPALEYVMPAVYRKRKKGMGAEQ